MTLALAVAAAACLGAAARYLLDQVVQHQHAQPLPWGTFVVNLLGSFALGVVAGLATRGGLPAQAASVLGTGLAGGFSTWSTYLWETMALAETGALLDASVNLLGGLALGLAAAATGLALATL